MVSEYGPWFMIQTLYDWTTQNPKEEGDEEEEEDEGEGRRRGRRRKFSYKWVIIWQKGD